MSAQSAENGSGSGLAPLSPETAAKPAMVNKGFNIRMDQYNDLLMLVAYRKVRNIHPSTASEILRSALDVYFASIDDQSFRQIGER